MQNLLFLSAEILSDANFSRSIFRFSAGIQLSHPTDGGKKAGLIFISEKRQGAFLTPKKGQGAIFTSKKGQGAIFTSNEGQGAILNFKKRAEHGALRKSKT